MSRPLHGFRSSQERGEGSDGGSDSTRQHSSPGLSSTHHQGRQHHHHNHHHGLSPLPDSLQSPCLIHSYLQEGSRFETDDGSLAAAANAPSGYARRGDTAITHTGTYPQAGPSSYFDHRHDPRSRSLLDDFPDGTTTPSRRGSSSTEVMPNSQRRRGGDGPDSSRAVKKAAPPPPPSHRGPRGAAEPDSGDEHHDHHHEEEDDDERARISRSRAPSDEEQQDGATVPSSGYSSHTTGFSSSDEDDDDSDDAEKDKVRSLTRQLAETAVGVREMSKQLGRARVKSTINSVLIITKARDNELIKLTREIALWLMLTPRNGSDRGVIVYVDSQLRNSKRFDAAGIESEYPHLFQPISRGSREGGNRRRQSSATASVSSLSSQSGTGNDNLNGNSGSNGSAKDQGQLRYWTADMCSRSPHLFDFVVTLGGDGTVLFCSWLFQRIVPPVLPFALGSLGFLTNFDFSDHQKVMSSAIEQGIRVNLRMRFTATVYRANLPSNDATVHRQRRQAIKSGRTGEIIMRNVKEGGWDRIERPFGPPGPSRSQANDDVKGSSPKKDREVMCFSTRPVETFEVLNDLVVDRGPSPYVSLLEVFGDEHHMTTAQADGLCISTPTGSTAYSLSAGGSLVHPEIPAILITPICPHTLSFRPMLLPDSMELRIAVPYNSRSTAWASFDGRGRVELKQGDHIKVTASRYPFPTVCNETQSVDWFKSISRTLKWNERQRQKSFVVVEEGREKTSSSQREGGKAKKGGSNSGTRSKRSADRQSELAQGQKQAEKAATGANTAEARQSTGIAHESAAVKESEASHPKQMSLAEKMEREQVRKNAQGELQSAPLNTALSGPAKIASISRTDGTEEATTGLNSASHHRETALDSNHVEEDDNDDDEGDDEEDEDEDDDQQEEAFDIDDTSAVATRPSSPHTQPANFGKSSSAMLSSGSGLRQQQHSGSSHHHQQGHASAPQSHRPSFEALQKLLPFTTKTGSGMDSAPLSRWGSSSRSKEQSAGTVSSGAPKKKSITFDSVASPSSLSSGGGAKGGRREQSNHLPASLEGGHSSVDSGNNSAGLLNSPDRFSAAGPPAPPRRLSQRHFADADFRLDGSAPPSDSENESDGKGQSEAGGKETRSSSKKRTPSVPGSKAQTSGSNSGIEKHKVDQDVNGVHLTSGRLQATEDAVKGAAEVLHRQTAASAEGSEATQRQDHTTGRGSRGPSSALASTDPTTHPCSSAQQEQGSATVAVDPVAGPTSSPRRSAKGTRRRRRRRSPTGGTRRSRETAPVHAGTTPDPSSSSVPTALAVAGAPPSSSSSKGRDSSLSSSGGAAAGLDVGSGGGASGTSGTALVVYGEDDSSDDQLDMEE